MNGAAVLLSVNLGTEESPDWEVIPCQTTGEYSLSAGTIDTSCKDAGDATNEPGRRERSVSIETIAGEWPMLVDSPDTAHEFIRDCAENGVQVGLRFTVEGEPVEEGIGTITSYGISAPDQDAVTVSIEVAISGALTPVAGS